MVYGRGLLVEPKCVWIEPTLFHRPQHIKPATIKIHHIHQLNNSLFDHPESKSANGYIQGHCICIVMVEKRWFMGDLFVGQCPPTWPSMT
jgi:hypothetical protein